MDWQLALSRGAGLLGAAGLVVIFPLYLSSGLAAPLWAIALLLLFWAALATLAVRWWRTRPAWILVLPFIGVGVWVLALTLGENLLGWQA